MFIPTSMGEKWRIQQPAQRHDKVDGNEPSQQLWTFPSVDTETANVKQQPGSSGERTCWARAGWEAGSGDAGAALAFTQILDRHIINPNLSQLQVNS